MYVFDEIWRRLPTSRRTREHEAAAKRECALKEDFARRAQALESQILLLRAENRALLNSVLGIAGIPPIMVTDPAVLPSAPGTPREVKAHFAQYANGGSRNAGVPPATPPEASADKTSRQDAGATKTAHAHNDGRIVAPMRRRSWHQIYRMLEWESSRRKADGQRVTD